jgi:hypothetical protein
LPQPLTGAKDYEKELETAVLVMGEIAAVNEGAPKSVSSRMLGWTQFEAASGVGWGWRRIDESKW